MHHHCQADDLRTRIEVAKAAGLGHRGILDDVLIGHKMISSDSTDKEVELIHDLFYRHCDQIPSGGRFVKRLSRPHTIGTRAHPFHKLATEGQVHMDKNHIWHLEKLAKLAATGDQMFVATPFRQVTLNDKSQIEGAIKWWNSLTSKGGEGMVVKPLEYIARGKRRLIQPAIKCRGKEYPRIIYGPEYDLPENLERLRNRGLDRKRSMAFREFARGTNR